MEKGHENFTKNADARIKNLCNVLNEKSEILTTHVEGLIKRVEQTTEDVQKND